MWEKLRQFSALDGHARKLFLQALVILPVVSLSLKALGFRTTQTALRKIFSVPGNGPDPDSLRKCIALTAHMVSSAGRHSLIHCSCLAISLTLRCLLGHQGISCEMRIGIRKENGELQAHAWVERDGVALNEPDEHHRHYAAFDKAFSTLSQDESQAEH